MVSSECMVLQGQVDVDHRSGSPVPRSDCICDIPGYVEGASEWGVDLTMGFRLAWVAVPTAEYG